MNSLLWLAIVLFVAWLVLRLALAVTGAFLHLLWVAGLILLILWLFNKVRGSTA